MHYAGGVFDLNNNVQKQAPITILPGLRYLILNIQNDLKSDLAISSGLISPQIINYQQIQISGINFQIIGIGIYTGNHYVYCEINPYNGMYRIINDENTNYLEDMIINRGNGYVYLYQRV